ncbi:hypothetical protein [Sinomonas sp. B1-1]|uniref:hypothetical protein n=1 Tax=Sinomonas sp. B1-1 TaxID=3141454 RepID=UPI003D2D5756
MTWLAWITFGIAVLLAVVRIPAALRGENRLMMWLFTLFAATILLSIERPYLAIDALLGGVNLANLLLRFFIYAVCLLLAVRIARAFGSRGAEAALYGPWGLGALGVVAAGTVASFLLMGLQPSSVGLHEGTDEVWFGVYAALGRVYPTFTGVVLIPSLFRATVGAALPALRVAAGLIGAGYTLLIFTNLFPLMPLSWVPVMQTMNYSVLLLLFAGLTVIWVASLQARRRAASAPRRLTR